MWGSAPLVFFIIDFFQNQGFVALDRKKFERNRKNLLESKRVLNKFLTNLKERRF